jgi:hypothetical protein
MGGTTKAKMGHPPRDVPRFGQAPETGFSFLNLFHNRQDISKRTRKSVKTRDYEYIALS